jgi:hypothetical protein
MFTAKVRECSHSAIRLENDKIVIEKVIIEKVIMEK